MDVSVVYAAGVLFGLLFVFVVVPLVAFAALGCHSEVCVEAFLDTVPWMRLFV